MSAITEDPALGVPHVSGALADGEAEIQLRGVSKRFSARRRETLALTDIELGIRRQELQPRVAAPRRRVRDAKITWHAAAIKHGKRDKLKLGNLEAGRDWGYAEDYVEAMWMIVQQDEPGDYVIATNSDSSVRDCVEIACDKSGLSDWEQYVETDQALVRPAEVDHLIRDYSKAERELGWRPKTSFEELIRVMTRSDLELLER